MSDAWATARRGGELLLLSRQNDVRIAINQGNRENSVRSLFSLSIGGYGAVDFRSEGECVW